jgi:hypothetical protein
MWTDGDALPFSVHEESGIEEIPAFESMTGRTIRA